MPQLIAINSELSTLDGHLRTYINVMKADWVRYAEACDEYLAEAGETKTVEQAVKTIRISVNKATGLFIPTSCIRHFQPTLPASVKLFADERDRKRRLNHADETLYDLNKQIQKLLAEDKRIKWQSTIDKCDHRTCISYIWRLVMSISGQKTHTSSNKGVRFADTTYLDPKMISNKFAHQFAPPPIRLAGDKFNRQLKWQFHQLPLIRTPSFTPADTNEAIRLAKSSTAIGPNGMSTLHLKKLAHGAINCLTNIFNLSISTGQMPEVWRKAIVIPIVKHGKDNNIGKNWRPVRLLCPAAKTLAKLMLPKIQTHIPFHPAQHDSRPKHSACTALITADIAAGICRKKQDHRTVLFALDLTAAFDNVEHQHLPDCEFNTNIPTAV